MQADPASRQRMKKILVAESIRPSGMEMLRKEAEVVVAPDRNEATVAGMLGDFDALITRTTMIDGQVMAKGQNLVVVGRHGAGLDLVDVEYATEHGICVVHTPAANARSVAEYVVALMLSLTRQVIPGDYAQRVERDFGKRNRLMGHDLENKVLGIIGMGRIGRNIAGMCGVGFAMQILGYDPYVSKEDLAKAGIEKVDSVEEILARSDFVSLNLPLTEEVRGLINLERLKLMKKTAYLINCARGPIVDEKALGIALREGMIAGAALDVFAEEPPRRDDPLFDLPNLIATPHIATMTHESMDLMSTTLAAEVLAVLKGERPHFLANAQVWEKRRSVQA